MRIGIAFRTAARRSAGLLLAMTVVTAPAVVLASHQFPDVPNDHPFHAEIGAIAEAGITAGFIDGGYHPSEAVTRQAMAAFMQRGFGRVGREMGDAVMTDFLTVSGGSAEPVPVRQMTLTVPGASNAFGPQQMVYLRGRIVMSGDMSNATTGCPCEFNALIYDTTASVTSETQSQTFQSTFGNALLYVMDVEALLPAAPGAHKYQVEVGLTLRDPDREPASFAFMTESSLTAMTFPFGPAGTSDL